MLTIEPTKDTILVKTIEHKTTSVNSLKLYLLSYRRPFYVVIFNIHVVPIIW